MSNTNKSTIAAVLAVSQHGALILASRGSALLAEWSRDFAGDALFGLGVNTPALGAGLWLYEADREIDAQVEREVSQFAGPRVRRLSAHEAELAAAGNADWF
jgi:hypothetical protein